MNFEYSNLNFVENLKDETLFVIELWAHSKINKMYLEGNLYNNYASY
jgi:hypothetical protein